MARATATLVIPPDLAIPGDATSEFVVATLGDERALWFFAEYRDSKLAAPRLRSDSEHVDGKYRVRVTAESLIRDVAVLADKVHPDARVDDMLVTLLPGVTVEFLVTAPDGLDAAEFAVPDVLRSANDLVVIG